MNPDPSITPGFWDQRYASGKTPWDQHGVPECLRDYLKRTPVSGRALVPGCGSGYEILTLHECGWPVLGLDFSPAAVAQAQRQMGPLAQLVRVGDFFAPADDMSGFSLVYERTFLCALPPELHVSYARRMAEIIRPGGVLCGFFFLGPEEEPPPHPLSQQQINTLLGESFICSEDLPVADSLPLFAGKERWQVWRRR
ncbi:methyltransferase domain-containing protein [Oleiharenicola lentus]|jgi:thiopurine S-methyltransferase|uniref:Methyltransferase domain-containing protein n=1 Tax=Oleiharenicola lentus TaxID=2508720 RepID=A0A4Q1C8F5_9BACT|nr:methyltransferase domain-containing protein [Oleiharenicola lentus]RXK55126.1 methyltransferase domain-containing protein [Oleiharenicola lentus]